MLKKLILLLFLFPVFVSAQQQLTLQDAIDKALKNNFDILIAKENVNQATISNTIGMAGGLPTLGITTSDNNTFSNVHQEYNTGADLNKSNVTGNSINGAISASIPLFNGFKVIATKEQLDALQTKSELLLNVQIQNTMAAIMVTYFDIVRQENYLSILNSSLNVSKEKFNIVSSRRNVGMANDADYLQAQIDVSSVEQNIQTQKLVIAQAKTDLQQLMGLKEFSDFSVNDSIIVDETLDYNTTIKSLQQNPQFLALNQQIKINETVVKQINAQRYPNLKINTSYNFSYAENQIGSTLVNQSYGPQIGFTLQIPIYNGNQFKTQQDVARSKITSSTFERDNLLSLYTSDAYKTYLSYQNTLEQLSTQKANYELSRQLVTIVMKRFEANMATMLDVKAAQLSFENSGYMLINLQYAAKASEIELKRLIYQLK